MHSRKARMNDGYYESQSRSFQNSKYNSSSRYSNYYRDRETSPPKRLPHRSVSPEGSPRDGRDRYHQNQSSSYRNKDREREYKKDKYPAEKRGRERDLEYKNYNSKKPKTRDRSSSEDEHKEERLYDKRYGDRDTVRRPLEKERRYGDWKEMISKGSGKKYYYNERDKSSQWEKPEEWSEYEMQKEYPSSRGYRDKERERGKGRDDRYNNRRSYSSSKHSRGNSRVRWPHEPYPSTSSSMSHSRRDGDNADMEISPDSTPTSEPSYASPSANINNANVAEDPLANTTSPNGHVPSKHHHNNQSSTSGKQNSKQNSTTATSASPSTHHNNYHSSHHHRHRSVSPNNDAINDVNNSNSIRNSPAYGNNSLAGANNHHLIGDGPPTPEMDLNSGGDHRRIDGVTGGVSSLQSVMSATTLSNRLHLLTPSLAKFFRVDLLSHVTNWPSELLEKQAQKCAEEVYLLGDLECSRISAEIQCARSIVRVAEIAATIQGQRRLFLQEQIKEESQTPNSAY